MSDLNRLSPVSEVIAFQAEIGVSLPPLGADIEWIWNNDLIVDFVSDSFEAAPLTRLEEGTSYRGPLGPDGDLVALVYGAQVACQAGGVPFDPETVQAPFSAPRCVLTRASRRALAARIERAMVDAEALADMAPEERSWRLRAFEVFRGWLFLGELCVATPLSLSSGVVSFEDTASRILRDHGLAVWPYDRSGQLGRAPEPYRGHVEAPLVVDELAAEGRLASEVSRVSAVHRRRLERKFAWGSVPLVA